MATSQYGGAAGVFGGFGRCSANNNPGTIQIEAGGAVILRVQHLFDNTGAPWPTNPECVYHAVWVEYILGSGPVVVSASALGLPTQWVGTSVSPPHFPILNCNDDQSEEVRFKLGTYDSVTHLHAADGYIEVKVNGVVQISITGIALGLNGTAGYDHLRVAPSGIVDQASDNGGLKTCYMNAIDTYGAGTAPVLINDDYSVLTDADLWSNLGGPWQRFTAFSIASTTAPVKSGTKVVANIDYMRHIVAPTPLTPGGGGTLLMKADTDVDGEGGGGGGGGSSIISQGSLSAPTSPGGGYVGTGGTDDSDGYQAFVKTRAYPPGGTIAKIGTVGQIQQPLIVTRKSLASLQLTIDKDRGKETQTNLVSLQADGTETRVMRKFEGAGVADAGLVQFKLGDEAATANRWTIDRFQAKRSADGDT